MAKESRTAAETIRGILAERERKQEERESKLNEHKARAATLSRQAAQRKEAGDFPGYEQTCFELERETKEIQFLLEQKEAIDAETDSKIPAAIDDLVQRHNKIIRPLLDQFRAARSALVKALDEVAKVQNETLNELDEVYPSGVSSALSGNRHRTLARMEWETAKHEIAYCSYSGQITAAEGIYYGSICEGQQAATEESSKTIARAIHL